MLQKSGRLVLWEAMFILELHSAETQGWAVFGGTGFSLCLLTLNAENIVTGKITENLPICFQLADVRHIHPVVL